MSSFRADPPSLPPNGNGSSGSSRSSLKVPPPVHVPPIATPTLNYTDLIEILTHVQYTKLFKASETADNARRYVRRDTCTHYFWFLTICYHFKNIHISFFLLLRVLFRALSWGVYFLRSNDFSNGRGALVRCGEFISVVNTQLKKKKAAFAQAAAAAVASAQQPQPQPQSLLIQTQMFDELINRMFMCII